MKLQEFVSETLKEIIAGIKEAQKYAESEGAWVSPRVTRPEIGGGTRPVRYVAQKGGATIEQIEFDVAVTSTGIIGNNRDRPHFLPRFLLYHYA